MVRSKFHLPQIFLTPPQKYKPMIQSAVTISIVAEAKKGPFVYHDDVAEGCRKAAELGYDAVEIFAPSPDCLLYTSPSPRDRG